MADPVSPFSPDMQQQMAQLLALSTNRVQSTEPIHQAAMAMASRLAPAYARGAMTAPSTLPGGGSGLFSGGGSSGGLGSSPQIAMAFMTTLLQQLAKKKAADAAAAAAGTTAPPVDKGGGFAFGAPGGAGLGDIGTPGYAALAGSLAAPAFPQLGGGGGTPGSNQVGNWGWNGRVPAV